MLCRTTYRFTDRIVSVFTEGGFSRTDEVAFYRVCKLTHPDKVRRIEFSRDDEAHDLINCGYRIPKDDEVLLINADIHGATSYYYKRELFETIE